MSKHYRHGEAPLGEHPSSPFPWDWLLTHAGKRPESPAVGTPDGWTTYGQLAAQMEWLSPRLADAGVSVGTFVAILLPPGPLAVASVLAVQRLGGCAVELNREGGARTLAGVLEQTRARHVITLERDLPRFRDIFRAHDVSHLFLVARSKEEPQLPQGMSSTSIPEQVALGDLGPLADSQGVEAARDAKAPALLVYTSGSTGEPRGIVQSHENVDANTRAIVRYLALNSKDRALSILPLFYCFGRSILQTHLLVGGSVFFDHRFMYPRVVLEALGAERCTGFYGVPLTFETIRRHVDVREFSLQALRYLGQAGGAMRKETVRWARDVFAPAELFIMYGQTEATARLSFLPPERAVDKEGSIGKGLDNVELRIVDDQGRELPPREVGEVVARGPSITSGYFGAPEESQEVFRGGWLHTGDLGWKDEEGFIFLVGRSKDMLKLGGHRVGASEIENVLLEHPDVREAAVVGARDESGEEVAIAFVAVREGGLRDASAIRRFCRQSLPAFKIPAQVRFIDTLPKTASGKPAKEILRKDVSDGTIFKRSVAVGSGE